MQLNMNIAGAAQRPMSANMTNTLLDTVRKTNINLQNKVSMLTRGLDESMKKSIDAEEALKVAKAQLETAKKTIADLESKVKSMLDQTARKTTRKEKTDTAEA